RQREPAVAPLRGGRRPALVAEVCRCEEGGLCDARAGSFLRRGSLWCYGSLGRAAPLLCGAARAPMSDALLYRVFQSGMPCSAGWFRAERTAPCGRLVWTSRSARPKLIGGRAFGQARLPLAGVASAVDERDRDRHDRQSARSSGGSESPVAHGGVAVVRRKRSDRLRRELLDVLVEVVQILRKHSGHRGH